MAENNLFQWFRLTQDNEIEGKSCEDCMSTTSDLKHQWPWSWKKVSQILVEHERETEWIFREDI